MRSKAGGGMGCGEDGRGEAGVWLDGEGGGVCFCVLEADVGILYGDCGGVW